MTLLSPACIERLTRMDLRARQAAGGRGAGDRVAGTAGVGSIFREHRRYAPGDDLRYVDWNIYARHRSVHVKVFEHEENLDVQLLVDATASMGGARGSKLETACRALAVVGVVALLRGADVTLRRLSSGAVSTRYRGPAGVRALLRALAAVEGGERVELGPALRPAVGRMRRRGVAVLASDFLEGPRPDGGWEAAIAPLLARRVELVALHLVAREERSPELAGPHRLVDGETGAVAELDVDEDVLARYRRRFSEHVRSVRRRLRAHGVRHLVLAAEDATDFALVQSLLRGGVLA